jgi:hypothetical protein
MALVKCTECGTEVSDRAAACPKCANPMQEEGATAIATATPAAESTPTMPIRPTAADQVTVPAYDGAVPGGIQLGPGELIAKTSSFMFSILLFFLSTSMVLTNKRLTGEVPNTLLGVIPVGSRKFNYPLSNISAVGINTKISFWRLILGLILAWAGIALFGNSVVVGLVVLLCGLALLVGAFYTLIDIQNTGGGREPVQIAVTQKGVAQDFVAELNNVLAARL